MLFRKPINEITWDDVVQFCDQRTAENAVLDYKRDIPDRLEHTICAMANTFGGLILIGVEEDQEGKPKRPIAGINFERGLEEKVTSIALARVYPPVVPEIQVAKNGDKAVIVIRVPQSHETPHAIASNTQVYWRTGNRNQPEPIADLDKIEWLRNRRQKSEEFKEQLYSHANERFSNVYKDELHQKRRPGKKADAAPACWLTLSLCPIFPEGRFNNPPEMETIYRQILARDFMMERSFPFSKSPGTIAQDGFILHYLAFEDEQRSSNIFVPFHTELNCYGLFFFRQSLMSFHTNPKGEPDWVMRSTELFSRFDSFLKASATFYSLIGYQGPLEFKLSLEQIAGYEMMACAGRDALLTCHNSSVQFSEIVQAHALANERTRLIFEAARDMAWAFGWDLPLTDLSQWFRTMHSDTFPTQA